MEKAISKEVLQTFKETYSVYVLASDTYPDHCV